VRKMFFIYKSLGVFLSYLKLYEKSARHTLDTRFGVSEISFFGKS